MATAVNVNMQCEKSMQWCYNGDVYQGKNGEGKVHVETSTMKKTVVKLTIICQFHSCVCNGNWRMWRRTHHFKKLVYVGTKDVCMQLWPNGESIRLLRWNAGIPELRSHHQPHVFYYLCVSYLARRQHQPWSAKSRRIHKRNFTLKMVWYTAVWHP